MNLLEQKILDGLRYNREPFEKRLSASQLDKEIYELIMDIVYAPKDNKIKQTTIGSLIHKGLENIFKLEPDYESELDLEINFNDWKLTGTIDLINTKNSIIFDFKTTKYNTVKNEIEKMNNCKQTNYELQLNIYRWLYWKIYNIEINKLIIVFLLKDGGWDYKTKTYKADYFELEYPIISFDKIEKLIEDKINQLNNYIDFETKEYTLPSECGSKNKYGYLTLKDGNKIPTKCELYCNHKNYCKLYEKYDYFVRTTQW